MAIKNYFQDYPDSLVDQAKQLIKTGQLKSYLLSKYPTAHRVHSDKQLFEYVNKIKQSYMKKSSQLDKVMYAKGKDLVFNALGTHTFVSRNHGGKLKSKHEIRIGASLKDAPEEMLRMLVVHELAHFKEKEHNKAFYNLCVYMQPDYCDVEFDTILFLILLDQGERLY